MTASWNLTTSTASPSYPKRWYLSNVTVGLKGRVSTRAKSRLVVSQLETQSPQQEVTSSVGYRQTGDKSQEVLIWSSGAPLAVGPDVGWAGAGVSPIVLSVSPPDQVVQAETVAPITPTVDMHNSARSVASPDIDVTTLSPAVAKAFERRRTQWARQSSSNNNQNRFGIRSVLRYSLVGIMVISLIIMASVVLPDLYYRINPEQASDVITLPTTGGSTEISEVGSVAPTPTPIPDPPIDVTLPEGSWLQIPSIGVDTQLLASEDPNEALNKGAWLVPDFGRPNDTSLPIIAAAHRFGWDWWWQTDFGRKNSFYSLPKLENGDTIEIVFNQRKYIYSVYGKEEGQAIGDYSADLILYTCKYFNSPERYFLYANRDIQAELSSQEQKLANELTGKTAAITDKVE